GEKAVGSGKGDEVAAGVYQLDDVGGVAVTAVDAAQSDGDGFGEGRQGRGRVVDGLAEGVTAGDFDSLLGVDAAEAVTAVVPFVGVGELVVAIEVVVGVLAGGDVADGGIRPGQAGADFVGRGFEAVADLR